MSEFLPVPADMQRAIDEAREALGGTSLADAAQDLYRAKQANDQVKAWPALLSAKDYENAGAALRNIKEEIERIERRRLAVSSPLHFIWKAMSTFLGKPNELNQETRNLIGRHMDAFDARVAREAREREQKIREAHEAETARLKMEAEEEAKLAEMNGNLELAHELRENVPEPTPVVVLQVAAPKVDGLRRAETWHAEVVDLALVPDEFVERTAKMKVLHALAKSNKGKNPPPGVRFVKDVIRSKV